MCDHIEDSLSTPVSQDTDRSDSSNNQASNQHLDETELNRLAELLRRFRQTHVTNKQSSNQANNQITNQTDNQLSNKQNRFIRKSIIEIARLIQNPTPVNKHTKDNKRSKKRKHQSVNHDQHQFIQQTVNQTIDSGTLVDTKSSGRSSAEQQDVIQLSNNQTLDHSTDQPSDRLTESSMMSEEMARINHSSFGLRAMHVTSSSPLISQSVNQTSDQPPFKRACRRKFDFVQTGQVREPTRFMSQSVDQLHDQSTQQHNLSYLHNVIDQPTDRSLINQSISKDADSLVPFHTSSQSTGQQRVPKRHCYTENCRQPVQPHLFYHQFCGSCAALNWSKRRQLINLTDWIVVLTGCRVKIGFCVGLRVLRGGGTLIGTSRFPSDTVRRYLNEKDSDTWKDRLHIYGLDLRDTKATHEFVRVVSRKYGRVDLLINNAAQTIRKPVAYYKHLMEGESVDQSTLPPDWKRIVQTHDCHTQRTINQSTNQSIDQSNNQFIDQSSNQSNNQSQPDNQSITSQSNSLSTDVSNYRPADVHYSTSSWLSQLVLTKEDEQSANQSNMLFPVGQLDVTGQQIDLRSVNSWSLRLDEVDSIELIEDCAINVISPFILTSGFRKAMANRSISQSTNQLNIPSYSHIVNVSAMEGKFERHKSPYHPQTNMCKAALNMMTRTSAQDYAADRIWMNSVDTGWINDENTFNIAKYNREVKGFRPPLDEEDAAARILDPIVRSIRDGVHEWGKFFKDYQHTSW